MNNKAEDVYVVSVKIKKCFCFNPFLFDLIYDKNFLGSAKTTLTTSAVWKVCKRTFEVSQECYKHNFLSFYTSKVSGPEFIWSESNNSSSPNTFTTVFFLPGDPS